MRLSLPDVASKGKEKRLMGEPQSHAPPALQQSLAGLGRQDGRGPARTKKKPPAGFPADGF
jgi:hypothetical protein